jgi:hypothetical protein
VPFVNVTQRTDGGGFDPMLTNPIGPVVFLSLDKNF